jgi:GT2 family glycosyltransferase
MPVFAYSQSGQIAERLPLPTSLDPIAGRTGVSVIVPVYNGGFEFARCLQSLSRTSPPPDEIIVVGDADTDGSTALAAHLGMRTLRLATRGGPARARNCGARAARGQILFFVDADVMVQPDAIAQVAASLPGDEMSPVAVFGCYDEQPSAPNFLSQYKNLLHHYVHSTASEEASTFWAACGGIRRDVFMAVGGFDEGYGEPCIEDVELGYRLKGAGHRIQLRKSLQVTHLKQWTARSLVRTDFRQRALPWATLILRNRHFINDLNVGMTSRISVMTIYAVLGALALAAVGWHSLMGLVAAAVAVLLSATLLVLNRDVYGFFLRKRGLWFAMQTIPWHWLYFMYSGLAFAISWARYLAERHGSLTRYAPIHRSELMHGPDSDVHIPAR